MVAPPSTAKQLAAQQLSVDRRLLAKERQKLDDIDAISPIRCAPAEPCYAPQGYVLLCAVITGVLKFRLCAGQLRARSSCSCNRR